MRNVIFAWMMCAPAIAATTITVKSGQSIQEAVKKANSGDRVEVYPGEYKEAVVVEKADIRLIGVPQKGEWPVLNGEGKRNDGVIALGHNFEMAYFQVKNYKGNGVMTQGADNINLHHLVVQDTGIYGIYPTRGSHIKVEDTITSGIADAAIYIGMCTHVDVRRNEVFKNVAGIEIENSTHVLVEGNTAHDNAGGILVFNLPGLPVKTGEDIIVRRNIVYENNHKNFGAPGSVVGNVPSGSGIIVLAADKVRVEDNIVRDNHTGGLIFSDLEYIADSSQPDPKLDPNFDDNKVLNNFFLNNGTKPEGKVRLLLMVKHFALTGGDVLAYGKGSRNCLTASLRAKTLGTKEFKNCAEKESTAEVASMLTDQMHKKIAGNGAVTGAQLFDAVCAGCHGQGIRLIGPPVEEIQNKYHKNPAGIVAFATSPKKVRDGYPEMPAQAHLGKDKLFGVAEYILALKGK